MSCSAEESGVKVFVHEEGQSQHSFSVSLYVQGDHIALLPLAFVFLCIFVPGLPLHVSIQPYPCYATEQCPVVVGVEAKRACGEGVCGGGGGCCDGGAGGYISKDALSV